MRLLICFEVVYCYIDKTDFCVLILYPTTLVSLFSYRFFWYLWVFYIRSCLWRESFIFSFQFECLYLFIYFLPNCSCEDCQYYVWQEEQEHTALSYSWYYRRSFFFHHWMWFYVCAFHKWTLLYWGSFLFLVVYHVFMSWNGVVFFLIVFFLHQSSDDVVFVHSVNVVYYTDWLHIFSHLCIPGINFIWSWCSNPFSVLLKSVCFYYVRYFFVSVFIRDTGL